MLIGFSGAWLWPFDRFASRNSWLYSQTFDKDASSHQISEAVLTTCSTLITVIKEEDNGSRFVQFSHFSVKQFLTSDRLRTSDAETSALPCFSR
jgi:hypothetical protein